MEEEENPFLTKFCQFYSTSCTHAPQHGRSTQTRKHHTVCACLSQSVPVYLLSDTMSSLPSALEGRVNGGSNCDALATWVGQLLRHLSGAVHAWIDDIPTVPICYPAKPQRDSDKKRGKKTMLSLTLVLYREMTVMLELHRQRNTTTFDVILPCQSRLRRLGV